MIAWLTVHSFEFSNLMSLCIVIQPYDHIKVRQYFVNRKFGMSNTTIREYISSPFRSIRIFSRLF